MPLQGVQVTPGAGPPILTRILPNGTHIQLVQVQLTGEAGTDLVLEAGARPAAESLSVVWASDAPPIDINVTGLATEATLLTVSLEATQQLVLGELTAIGADTAALIVGQDAGNATLVSILGAVDTLETGQATANAHLAAIEASSGAGGAVPPATAATTAVAAAIAGVQLLAANAARKGATIYNDSTAELLVLLGTPVSAAAFTLSMLPGAYYEVPFGYTGRVDGIWAEATGNARMTELTA